MNCAARCWCRSCCLIRNRTLLGMQAVARSAHMYMPHSHNSATNMLQQRRNQTQSAQMLLQAALQIRMLQVMARSYTLRFAMGILGGPNASLTERSRLADHPQLVPVPF